jgi:hypothetical protein
MLMDAARNFYKKGESFIFGGITPCDPLRGNGRLHLLLAASFTLVSCLAYSSTLKIEAIYSYETLVEFQRDTWRYIPEDITLHNHRCENLTSYMTRFSPR